MGTQKKAQDLGKHPLFGWANKKPKKDEKEGPKKSDGAKKKGTPKKGQKPSNVRKKRK